MKKYPVFHDLETGEPVRWGQLSEWCIKSRRYPELFLYRIFGADDELLYIGVAWNLGYRFATHQRKPWWPEVRRLTFEVHSDRNAALRAETLAIAEENPKYNILRPKLAR